MFRYVWPMMLVVSSNVIYQICAKSVPEKVNPFASLTVTYAVGALVSAVLYFCLRERGTLLKEFAQMNAAPFVFGIVLVGLEAGWIYAYQAGWQVSTATVVQSSFLAVLLIFVGRLLYHEPLTWNKLIGVAICLVGLVFINMK